MKNIIRAIFEPGQEVAIAYRPDKKPIYQWNYGQVLQIHGLDLPKAVEVHFSHNMVSGAITRIGTTSDKIMSVAVPEVFLESNGAITAYVYLSDKESGQTEYKVRFDVRSRPKPEAWDSPEDRELFREAIEAVNTSAGKAEDAAVRAEVSAGNAEQSAQDAEVSATAAKTSETAAKNLADGFLKTVDDAKVDITTQTAQEKEQAISAIRAQGEEVQENISESVNTANTSKANLETAINTASTAKSQLERVIADVDATGESQVQAVNNAGFAQVQAVKQEGADQIQIMQSHLADYAKVEEVSELRSDLGELGKKKIDTDLIYEIGEGETTSSAKMMDISGEGEMAKIVADSVYRDNLIPIPNIPETTINGLTYSVNNGIISVNGTANPYTLIDMNVNLYMMDNISGIGYKLFVIDGSVPSGLSVVLGISISGYPQTLTNNVQEKKSAGLVTYNNKNIGISVNNNTTVDVKFGVIIIPKNEIPAKFAKGYKYSGDVLNTLFCNENMWAFGDNISKTIIKLSYKFKKSNLYGKSLFVAGDSVAYGYGSDSLSFGEIIAEKYKMILTKVAVSGATFAKRDGLTNSILEQVQSIDKTYDYILVEGGFNDYFQKDNGVSIGTMPKNMNSSRYDTTTYGALDSICLWLKQNYPSSKVLFVVPHKIMTTSGVIDSEFYPHLQAIRDVCEKYSIPFADIALKGGCTPFYQEFRDMYFSGDGIHPNKSGYETFYVPRIESEMEML